jgi:hypothetical protein
MFYGEGERERERGGGVVVKRREIPVFDVDIMYCRTGAVLHAIE